MFILYTCTYYNSTVHSSTAVVSGVVGGGAGSAVAGAGTGCCYCRCGTQIEKGGVHAVGSFRTVDVDVCFVYCIQYSKRTLHGIL